MRVAVKPVIVAETMRMIPPDNPGDLTHAHVLEGTLGNVSATKWNKLVAASVRLALSNGISLRDLQASLEANLEEGERGDSGFAIIVGKSVSIQGMDAGQCARNLVILARMLRCPLRVRFQWGKRGAFPGELGVLEWKP